MNTRITIFLVMLAGCASTTETDATQEGEQVAQKPPAWVGNAVTHVERSDCGGESCSGSARSASDGFTFDGWARQRAGFTSARFEVWEPGLTDTNDALLWQKLDVELHHRIGSAGAFETGYVSFDKRVGNNARYAFDLRKLDPYASGQCADGAVSDLEWYVTVNGRRLPEGAAVYHGTYACR